MFRDRQITVHHFAGNALVVCPRCGQPARVFTADGSENFYQARQWRVVCRSCGFHRDKTARCLTIYTGRRGTVGDPVFGLPLWLQKTCCGGNLLWAYNLDHLSFVESYIAATIRERSDAVRMGEGYRRRMSMVAKLPAWLKSARHRDEVLKTIQKLKRSLVTSQRA
ncbi:hypothetical protein [Allorhizocola rhizosphaerae]|uniref:hypothetical protein n=1 Tax=Allorhizocola rhizosphaerae TaxID=1872709 RepID=UPI001B8D69D4|nr:hypothetical protein [Allorhizocola rhizosphaerae]